MNKVNQFYMNNFSYDLDVGLNEFIMRRYEDGFKKSTLIQ